MRVLVLGGGGREHALVRALLQDPAVTEVHAAPGNAGIESDAHWCHPVDLTSARDVARLAEAIAADLVVIGPEGPLVEGAADALRERGIPTFGPSREASLIEASKAFAKDVMQAAGVPTGHAVACTTLVEVDDALARFGGPAIPFVVKDDGLAAGKGVLVAESRHLALAHAQSCLEGRPGAQVLVEEFLSGPEVSLFAVTDGTTVVPLIPAQDFKRVGDDDTGPNTGGMGAYAPLPWLPKGFVADVQARILQPVVDEMRRRGTPFVGLLYAGLIVTADGVRVIEFNARFGDPETQAVLALLETPLSGVLMAAATGRLAELPPLQWREGAAVTVVIAAAGYPESPRTGDPITLPAAASVRTDDTITLPAATSVRTDDPITLPAAASVRTDDPITLPAAASVRTDDPTAHERPPHSRSESDGDVTAPTDQVAVPPQGGSHAGAPEGYVLHAGTRRDPDGRIVSAGGRVLCAVGLGTDLMAAREAAYRVVDGIALAGSHHRRDIALRAARGLIALPTTTTTP